MESYEVELDGKTHQGQCMLCVRRTKVGECPVCNAPFTVHTRQSEMTVLAIMQM